jgi:hypothetical protein
MTLTMMPVMMMMMMTKKQQQEELAGLTSTGPIIKPPRIHKSTNAHVSTATQTRKITIMLTQGFL